MTPLNKVCLSVYSLEENIALVRLAAAAFAAQANLSLPEIDEIKVAVSEAVSNCVVHAYPHTLGIIEITMQSFADKLIFSITDYGRGISDIAKSRESSYSSLPEHMGLGFSFMDSFMDRLTVSSQPRRGTTVTLTKLLSSSCKAGE